MITLQMIHCILKILISVYCTICLTSFINAQNNFTLKFESTDDETTGWFIQNSNSEFIGIITKQKSDSQPRYCYLYKISEYGDTLLSRKFGNEDTLITINYLIQAKDNPIEYLISGKKYEDDKKIGENISYFIKLDNNFNTIWERFYKLRPNDINSNYEYYQNILKKSDSGYLFATNYDNPGDNRLVLFEMSDYGDSLRYRSYVGDSAGHQIMSLTYNHDSSAYLLYTFRAHPVPFNGEAQCIKVDLSLRQILVSYYPRWFRDGLRAKLLPNGNILTGGLYEHIEPPEYSHMAVFKHDTYFNQLGYCYVADPNYNIRKEKGRKSMDFYYPNSIFVSGTYNYDVGVWIQHPSWIVIGKMDDDLNLLTEKYIGGDAYYHFNTITATNDGGVLITTNRYDYLTQNYEHDAYIIKLDSNDLVLGLPQQDNHSSHVIVYPNPATSYVFVNTNLRNTVFILYDFLGNCLRKHLITDINTYVSLYDIPAGIYLWSLVKANQRVYNGKIIKTN